MVNVGEMKTISIEELHAQTEQVIRQAAQDTFVVTWNGLPQAILKPYHCAATLKQYWEERERMLSGLPRLAVDSSVYVSEDRDGR